MSDWLLSGIDYEKAMREFPASSAIPLDDYKFRLEACRTCNLCRKGKCLVTGSCARKKARAELETCPLNLWQSNPVAPGDPDGLS